MNPTTPSLAWLIPVSLMTVACVAPVGLAQHEHADQPTAAVPESYICPMHCEGDKAYRAPGKCPVCGMNLKKLTITRYTAQITPGGEQIKAGEPTTLTIRLKDPTSAPVKSPDGAHADALHVFAVSADLSWFAHEHAMPAPDGAFTTTLTIPAPGRYILFSDPSPHNIAHQVAPSDLTIPGRAPAPVPLKVDSTEVKVVDGYSVALKAASPLVAGANTELTAAISRDGKPITDLEPWLGAIGHLVIIAQDLKGFVHAHGPEGHQPPPGGAGHEIAFHAVLPTPGLYRAWVQFQHKGKVITVPFTFEVKPGSPSGK
jgi:hypothetical protein